MALWADSRGNLDERFSRDFLLTTVTLYWVTHTIASSIQDYFDNDNPRFQSPSGQKSLSMCRPASLLFFKNFVDEGTAPREWAERLF